MVSEIGRDLEGEQGAAGGAAKELSILFPFSSLFICHLYVPPCYNPDEKHSRFIPCDRCSRRGDLHGNAQRRPYQWPLPMIAPKP